MHHKYCTTTTTTTLMMDRAQCLGRQASRRRASMGRTAHHAAAAFDLSLSRSFARSSSRCCIAPSLVACCVGVAWSLSSVSLLRVLLGSSNIISLIGGFGGLGRHWRASLVSEISLSLPRFVGALHYSTQYSTYSCISMTTLIALTLCSTLRLQ